MADSIWQRVADHLRLNGWSVYPPNNKTGECTSEYIVLRDAGETPISVTSVQGLYDVLLYVPYNRYGTLETSFNKLKSDMAGLFPVVKNTGTSTPVYSDDTYKAHMKSVTYSVFKRK